jgi:hypothetical protein
MPVFTPFAFQGAASQTRTAFNFVTGSSSTDVQIIFVAFTPYYPFPSVYLDDENLATATTVYAGSTGLTKNSNSFYISDVDFCKGNLDQTIYRYWDGSGTGSLSPATTGPGYGYSTFYSASLCSGGGSTVVRYEGGVSPAATGFNKCFLPAGTSVKVSGSVDCYSITSLIQPAGSGASITAPYITNIYTNCAGCT